MAKLKPLRVTLPITTENFKAELRAAARRFAFCRPTFVQNEMVYRKIPDFQAFQNFLEDGGVLPLGFVLDKYPSKPR